MKKTTMGIAVVFALGAAALAWVGWGYVGTSSLALAMTLAIAAVYLAGALELAHFRAATSSLAAALAGATEEPPDDLAPWLERLHPMLRQPVRQRIAGERTALPGPALAPYLVGLLVMLGMLGTFLGMVMTFQGAVFALESSASLDAMRAALAAPVRGLGVAFGTSVAGVAASAMLGLMAALARRERLGAVRHLDARIASTFRAFSARRRQDQALLATAKANYSRSEELGPKGYIAKQDLVITTALIPGRAAPRLITDAQIATMKPGSVIFDLAVAQGGNVEGSAADQVVEKHGVKLIGYSNTPAHLAADTSALYARNLYNFLSAFWDKEQGRPVLDEEIGDAVRLTRGGEVVNERLRA